MCIQNVHDYAKCEHHSTSIARCPAYYKAQQQRRRSSSGRNLLGLLFNSGSDRNENYQHRKPQQQHCGRLVPHHVTTARQDYCEDCVVGEPFAPRRGDQHHQRKRPTTAPPAAFANNNKESAARRKHQHYRRSSPDSSSSSSSSRNHRLRHEVVSANTKTSVWLPDLEEHDRAKLATRGGATEKEKTYRQQQSSAHHQEAAAPVSPLKSPLMSKFNRQQQPQSSPPHVSKPTTRDGRDSYHQHRSCRQGSLQGSSSGVHRAAAASLTSSFSSRSPTFGSIPPMTKPAESRLAYQSYGKRAAAPPPPSPVAARRSNRTVGEPPCRRSAREAVPVPVADEEARDPRPSLRNLKRKPAKTYLNIRDQPIHTLPPVLPEYQVYLNAMPSLAGRGSSSSAAAAAAAAAHGGHGSARVVESKKELLPFSARYLKEGKDANKQHPRRLALKNLSRVMGLESDSPSSDDDSDDDSDLSFVCSDSRQLAEMSRR